MLSQRTLSLAIVPQRSLGMLDTRWRDIIVALCTGRCDIVESLVRRKVSQRTAETLRRWRSGISVDRSSVQYLTDWPCCEIPNMRFYAFSSFYANLYDTAILDRTGWNERRTPLRLSQKNIVVSNEFEIPRYTEKIDRVNIYIEREKRNLYSTYINFFPYHPSARLFFTHRENTYLIKIRTKKCVNLLYRMTCTF